MSLSKQCTNEPSNGHPTPCDELAKDCKLRKVSQYHSKLFQHFKTRILNVEGVFPIKSDMKAKPAWRVTSSTARPDGWKRKVRTNVSTNNHDSSLEIFSCTQINVWVIIVQKHTFNPNFHSIPNSHYQKQLCLFLFPRLILFLSSKMKLILF